MAISNITKGGLWISVGLLLSSFLGYVYWLIASKFVSSDVIGSIAAILSLQGMMIVISAFGIPRGLQRFIGQSWGKQDHQLLSSYLVTSFFFLLAISGVVASAIFIASLTGIELIDIGDSKLQILALLVLLEGGWYSVMMTLFQSIFRTHLIAFIQIFSSSVKIAVGLSLLALGHGFWAIISGYVVALLAMDGTLIILTLRYFREFGIKARLSGLFLNLSLLREAMRAGTASWIPEILRIAGERVGILGIYAVIGGAGAGLYFIAFSIASMLYVIPTNVLNLMLPLLSGMEDGKKRAIARVVKISSSLTVPLAMILVLYPDIVLSVLGSEYLKATDQLRILALGVIVNSIIRGYVNYIYALGKYRHVIMMGVALNGSQLILYPVLIPSVGDIGVAVAYTAGYFIALVPLAYSSRTLNFEINWKGNLKIIVFPASLSAALFFSGINWTIGIPILLLLSIFSYTRLGMITRDDSVEMLRAFMSDKSIAEMSSHTRLLVRLMFGTKTQN